MITADSINEIFATYRKYGWVPRRLLLTTATMHLGNVEPEIPAMVSNIDAAWFSRPPANGEIAWEIRYLGNTPFALLENLDETDAEFEQKLKNIEMRLKASVSAKRN